MTDNRMDVDSFEKTHENSFSSREKHLTQSLYSELKHLRKKPKTHDLQHHLPQSQNCHNLLDKSPIVKNNDDGIIQTETDRENGLKENGTVKNEVVSEADFSEAISLASLKRKRRKKSRKKVSNPDIPVKVETDSSFDPSVVMLKSLVDGISDVSIIWEIVRDKILPNFQIWNILLDKASYSYGLNDAVKDCFSAKDSTLKQNLSNTRKFIMVMEEMELLMGEFKCLMDSCLKLNNSPSDDVIIGEDPSSINLSPEICRAFEIMTDKTWKMANCSEMNPLYQYFFFDQDFEGQSERLSKSVHANVAITKKSSTKRAKVKEETLEPIGDNLDCKPIGADHHDHSLNSDEDFGDEVDYEDQDDDDFNYSGDIKNRTKQEVGLSEFKNEVTQPRKRGRKPKNGIERPKLIQRERSPNSTEKPALRPFRKNPDDKRYYCTFPGCTAGENKNWTCSSGVWKHFLSEHSQNADTTYCIFPCDVCERRFPTKALLNQHQKEKHITHFEFVCTVCAKRLPTNVALLLHMRMHTGEKPFSCDLCSYKSIRQAAVNQHKMRMHESENEPRLRKHVCDKCGKTFKERGKLKEHIKTHSDVRTFLCGFCGKGLKNRQSLNRHMFTHGLKNECTDCGKYFSTPLTLSIHQRDKHGMSI